MTLRLVARAILIVSAPIFGLCGSSFLEKRAKNQEESYQYLLQLQQWYEQQEGVSSVQLLTVVDQKTGKETKVVGISSQRLLYRKAHELNGFSVEPMNHKKFVSADSKQKGLGVEMPLTSARNQIDPSWGTVKVPDKKGSNNGKNISRRLFEKEESK